MVSQWTHIVAALLISVCVCYFKWTSIQTVCKVEFGRCDLASGQMIFMCFLSTQVHDFSLCDWFWECWRWVSAVVCLDVVHVCIHVQSHWNRNVSILLLFFLFCFWTICCGLKIWKICLPFVYNLKTCHSAIIILLLPIWINHHMSQVRMHLVLGCANFKIFGLSTGDLQLTVFHNFLFELYCK